ncbi:MAG: hypothetical protein ACLSV2_10410 [Clostridium sp.]
MQNFTGIMVINIIGYLLGAVLVIIGKMGFKKLEREFSQSNCDISEAEREKRLPYMISEMERKKRRPYLICMVIGCSTPVITSMILIVAMFKIV